MYLLQFLQTKVIENRLTNSASPIVCRHVPQPMVPEDNITGPAMAIHRFCLVDTLTIGFVALCGLHTIG